MRGQERKEEAKEAREEAQQQEECKEERKGEARACRWPQPLGGHLCSVFSLQCGAKEEEEAVLVAQSRRSISGNSSSCGLSLVLR